MKPRYVMISLLLLAFLCWSCSDSHPDMVKQSHPTVLPNISLVQSSNSVEVYDFLEVTLNVEQPNGKSAFTEVFVNASFSLSRNEKVSVAVQGFCDSVDGSIFRVRFMPMEAGEYMYSVTYWQDNLQKVHSGRFKAVDVKRRGLVLVDPAYPWHFLWKGRCGSGWRRLTNDSTYLIMLSGCCGSYGT